MALRSVGSVLLFLTALLASPVDSSAAVGGLLHVTDSVEKSEDEGKDSAESNRQSDKETPEQTTKDINQKDDSSAENPVTKTVEKSAGVVEDTVEKPTKKVTDPVSKTSNTVTETVGKTTETVENTVQSAEDVVEETTDSKGESSVTDVVTETTKTVKEATDSVVESTNETVQDTTEVVEDTSEGVTDVVENTQDTVSDTTGINQGDQQGKDLGDTVEKTVQQLPDIIDPIRQLDQLEKPGDTQGNQSVNDTDQSNEVVASPTKFDQKRSNPIIPKKNKDDPFPIQKLHAVVPVSIGQASFTLSPNTGSNSGMVSVPFAVIDTEVDRTETESLLFANDSRLFDQWVNAPPIVPPINSSSYKSLV